MTAERIQEIFAEEARELGRETPIPPVSFRDLDIGEERIHVMEWGQAPASVVLIHGAALNAYVWAGVLALWPGEVNAVAIDLPGHGGSTWRENGDYSPQTMAPVIDSAIAELQQSGIVAERPAVVGHSLGGLTALRSRQFADGEWSSLTLIDILPLPADQASVAAQFLEGPKSFASRQEITERAISFGLGGSRTRLERAVRLNTVQTEEGVRWRHHLGQLGAGGLNVGPAAEAWQSLAEGKTALGLVRGETGLIGDDFLRELDSVRAGVPVTTLAGGHNLHEDNPAALARALKDLVDALAETPQR